MLAFAACACVTVGFHLTLTTYACACACVASENQALELKKKLLPRVFVVRSSTQSQIEVFALLFATFRKKNSFKCVLHVQHDFSLFNQSDD